MASITAESPANKLKTITKLAYGIGDLGPAIVSAISGFFLNAFLIEIAGVRPASAALIFLIVKIWDSVNDPMIGALTDRTNTRWGRRRPWLLFGSVPFGLAFFLHWLVPDLAPAGLFWYYLAVALLLDTAFTAVNVPYAAMTPELTDDYDERTSLNAYRFSFSILGGSIAAALHGTIVGSFDGEAITRGYAISAAIWAAVIIISNIITFAFTEESNFQQDQADELGFFEGLKIAFSNQAFIYVTLLYLLAWLSVQFVQNNLLLYVKYWVQAEDLFPLMIIVLQFGSFIFLMIWTRVSERIGKQNVYYIGASVWIVAGILIFFVPAGQSTPIFFLAPLASVGVSVALLIPWSLLPDVIEVDELETGQRREGIFYGFFVFLQKLGISLGLAISNLILEGVGYVQPAAGVSAPTQAPAVLLTLRIFVGLVPVVILLASFLVLRRYPITRERYAEIRAELAARKQQ